MDMQEMRMSAKKLKPTKGEISHITIKNEAGRNCTFSVYIADGKFNIVEGRIFYKQQNHTVVKSYKGYVAVVNYIIKQISRL